jgi:hypothetical protein
MEEKKTNELNDETLDAVTGGAKKMENGPRDGDSSV